MNNELHNLPEAEYHASPVLSCSRLKPLALSPLHFKHALEQPFKSTPAMNLGSLVHAMVLEGDKAVTERFITAPEVDRRTKAGKSAYAEFLERLEGKIVVTADQMMVAGAIVKAISSNKTAAKLLANCTARESSFFFEVDGVEMKARLDAYTRSGLILDVKTTGFPVDQFQRQAYNLRYHLQAAIYSEAYRQKYGRDPEGFVFIVVETAPPHGMVCYLADDDFIAAGEAEFKRLLALYKQCQATNQWPGYDDTLHILELPAWAQGGMNDE